jgi:hypothetical protein
VLSCAEVHELAGAPDVIAALLVEKVALPEWLLQGEGFVCGAPTQNRVAGLCED